MESTKQNMAVGLTGMAAVAGILALLILFGHIPGWGEPEGYPVVVHAPTAGGLHVGSRVLLDGIVVGSVKDIDLRNDPTNGVSVTAKIGNGVKIPYGVVARISTSLFGGSAKLNFFIPESKRSEVTDNKVKFLPTSGKPAIIKGMSNSLVAKIGELSGTWKAVGENINKLVEPRQLSAVDSGSEPANLATVVQRLDNRLKSLKSIMAGIQDIVGNKDFRVNVREMAGKINKLTDSLNKQINEISKSLKGNINKLGKHYTALADHMSKAVDSLQKLTKKINAGHGTLDKLISDPTLYDNLNDAVMQLKAAANQGKLLIEKWKAEGLPVHF